MPTTPSSSGWPTRSSSGRTRPAGRSPRGARTCAPGETITEEGEAGRTFVVIESGDVTVKVHGKEVGKLGPGDSFGEMALIDKSARTATITADTEVHGYQLPVWSFRPLVESHPEMTWALLEALAERVRVAEART